MKCPFCEIEFDDIKDHLITCQKHPVVAELSRHLGLNAECLCDEIDPADRPCLVCELKSLEIRKRLEL